MDQGWERQRAMRRRARRGVVGMGPTGRRWSAVAVALLLAVSSLGWHTPGERRVVRGEILAEAPTAEVARCAYLEGGDASQGLVGWVVRLTGNEGDGWHAFRLSSWSAAQHSPLGITFYEDLGTSCTTSGAPLGHELRDGSSALYGDAVEGWVPRRARWAVIGRWSANVGVYYAFPPVFAVTGVGTASPFSLVISDPPPWGAS